MESDSGKIRKYTIYIFTTCKKRQKDRNINDLAVINILENKAGYRRRRNKSKDSYTLGKIDWNYCIEGTDLDDDKIRIILSFNKLNLLIITVIRIDYKGSYD